MTKVSSKAHARRPVNYWSKFNEWWRQVLEESGRRPDAAAINRWYEENARDVWAPNDLPTMVETRVHAKCLRSVDEVRNYFRAYRAQRRADAVARTEPELPMDEAEDDNGAYLSASAPGRPASRRTPAGPNSKPGALTTAASQRGGVSKVVASAVRLSRPASRTSTIPTQPPSSFPSGVRGTFMTISGFGESSASLPGGSWWRQQQPQTGHQPQTGQNPRSQRKQISGSSGGLAGSSVVITGYPYQQNPAARYHAASATQPASPATGPEHGVVNGQEGRVDVDAGGAAYDDSDGPCSSVSTASLDAIFCGLPHGEVDMADREGWSAYSAPLPMAAPVGVVVSTGIRERRVSGGGAGGAVGTAAGGAGVITGPPQQHPQLTHPTLCQQPRVQEVQRQQDPALQRLSHHQQMPRHGSGVIVGRNNTAMMTEAQPAQDLGTIFYDCPDLEPVVHAEVTLLAPQAKQRKQEHQHMHQHQMMMLGTHLGPCQEAAPGHGHDTLPGWPQPTPPTHPQTGGAPVTTGAHHLNRNQQSPLQQDHYTTQKQAPQPMRHNPEQQPHSNTAPGMPAFSSVWASGNCARHQLAGVSARGAPGGGAPVPQQAAVVASWGCSAPQGTEGTLGDVRAMEGVVCGAPVAVSVAPGDWVSATRDTSMGLRAVRSVGGAQGSLRPNVLPPCSQLMSGPQVVKGGRAQVDAPAPMGQSAQPPHRVAQQLPAPLQHLSWAHDQASQPLGMSDPQLDALQAPPSSAIAHHTSPPAWLQISRTDLPSAVSGDPAAVSPWSTTIVPQHACPDVCAGSGPMSMLFPYPDSDACSEVVAVSTLPPFPPRPQGDRPVRLLHSLGCAGAGSCTTTITPTNGANCPGSAAAASASWSAPSQSPPQPPHSVCSPQLGLAPSDLRNSGCVAAGPVAMTVSSQLLPQQPLACHHSQSAPIQVHAPLDVTKGLPSFRSGSWAPGPGHHGVQVVPTASAPVPFDVSHLVEHLRTNPTRAPCPPSLSGGRSCLGDGGGGVVVGGVRGGSDGQRSPSVTAAAAFRRHSQPGGDVEAYMAGLQQQQQNQQQYMLQRPRQQQEQQQQGQDDSRYPMVDLLQQWQRGDQAPELRAALSDPLAALSAHQGTLVRTGASGHAQPQALDHICNSGARMGPGGAPPGAATVQQEAPCATEVFRSTAVASAAAATTPSSSQAVAAAAALFNLMAPPVPPSAAEPSRSAFKGTLSAPLGDGVTPRSTPAADPFSWATRSQPVPTVSQPPQPPQPSMMQPPQASHVQASAIPQLGEQPALTAATSGMGFDTPGPVSCGFGSPGGGSWGDRALADLEGDSAWFASLLAADIPPPPLAYY